MPYSDHAWEKSRVVSRTSWTQGPGPLSGSMSASGPCWCSLPEGALPAGGFDLCNWPNNAARVPSSSLPLFFSLLISKSKEMLECVGQKHPGGFQVESSLSSWGGFMTLDVLPGEESGSRCGEHRPESFPPSWKRAKTCLGGSLLFLVITIFHQTRL